MSLSIYTFEKVHSSKQPLYRQLYSHIKRLILNGDLKREARIPATRTLAATLGLSRNTVKTAMDQLAAEGYVQTRLGSGVFVSMNNPEEFFETATTVTEPTEQRLTLPRVAINANVIKPSAGYTPSNRAFSVGVPDLSAFPFGLWRKIYASTLRTMNQRLMGYGDPRGLPELRSEISNYVRTSRGVRCTADQILITTGAQQSLDLIARMVITEGERVALEDPGYRGARSTFLMAGAKLAPIPVTSSGLDVQKLAQLDNIKLVYTTPAHQYPNAAAMPVNARLSLLHWAEKSKCWIIEDDYDSEFQYESRPIPSLQGLSEHNNVIYIGSFSKTLFPSLRLGYLIMPPNIVKDACGVKQSVYGAQPLLEQMVTATFIRDGHFHTHLKRMRGIYGRKSEALVKTLEHYLPSEIAILGGKSGMHLVVEIKEDVDDQKIVDDLRQAGFAAAPLSQHYLSNPRKGLILGYGCASLEDIEEGVEALSALIKIAIKPKFRHV